MATCAECVHVEVCRFYINSLLEAGAKHMLEDLQQELAECLNGDVCEQFLARDRMAALPCKVGDILFVPTRNFISEYKIDYFHVGAYGIWFNTTLIAGISTHLRSENIESIGKTVFLTREEAEQALKERKFE